MKRAGVIGHPISHSRSPLIHGYWLEKYAIEGEYKTYDIPPQNLKEGLLKLRDTGLAGCNVTLPHKQEVMAHCTTLDDEATRIGAVNTIIFHESGEIEGRNTDAFGFMRNITETHPDFSWRNIPVVVLGAGGATRAILFSLKRAGVSDIRICNRTIAAAETLADDFDCTVYDWEERNTALTGAGAVINTTSLGMVGHPPLELDLSPLNEGALVCDIVYTPLLTPLLEQADARGCRVVSGIGMLLHQARPAFRAWFGVMPDIDDQLRHKVLA